MARNRHTMREGIIAGLIGYAIVATFYSALDTVAGRAPIFTLDLLGKFVFRGMRDPTALGLATDTDLGAMMAYHGLHLVATLAVGIAVSLCVAGVERQPRMGYPLLAALVAGYALVITLLAVFAQDLTALVPLWTLVTASTLAALGGGVYLWKAHPGLWGRVRARGHSAS